MLDIETIIKAGETPLLKTDFSGLGTRHKGKVRDIYVKDSRRYLIATDRFSAFDRVLGAIPHRGQVLNQLAAWWFENTRDVVANHLVSTPDANVSICREADTLPVEVIVRGYITGVTPTALWTLYNNGVDKPYGLTLPEGLKKNDRLPEPVITPTTKGGPGERDERLSEAEVVEKGLVSAERWQEVRTAALALFNKGTELADKGGLVLVDTKYEFGTIDGELTLIDEVHTPDSSRYWKSATYAGAGAEGREPEGFSKEFLRLYLADKGFSGDGEAPPLPPELLAKAAQRYIEVYECLTGEAFVPAELPAGPRIARALEV